MPLKNTATNKPQEIAAIDLGSNSFHMVIARVVNGLTGIGPFKTAGASRRRIGQQQRTQ